MMHWCYCLQPLLSLHEGLGCVVVALLHRFSCFHFLGQVPSSSREVRYFNVYLSVIYPTGAGTSVALITLAVFVSAAHFFCLRPTTFVFIWLASAAIVRDSYQTQLHANWAPLLESKSIHSLYGVCSFRVSSV